MDYVKEIFTSATGTFRWKDRVQSLRYPTKGREAREIVISKKKKNVFKSTDRLRFAYLSKRTNRDFNFGVVRWHKFKDWEIVGQRQEGWYQSRRFVQEISNHRSVDGRAGEREQPVDIIQPMDRNYIIIPEPCDGYSDWIGKSLY